MLKPNFNPLFYNFFLYDVPGPERKSSKSSMKPLNLSSSSPEKKEAMDRREIKRSIETKAGKYQRELIALVNSKLEDNNTDAKNLGKKVRSQMGSLVLKYSNKIETAKNAKALQKIEGLFKAEMKFAGERIKYAIEGLEKREKMKAALLKHQSEVYAWAWEEHENVGKELREKGDWGNLKLVTVAYLHQWKKVYSKSLDKASPDNLHILFDQNFDKGKGMFKSGPLVKDLDGIKKNIGIVLGRWLEDNKERTVYKSEDWGDDYYSHSIGKRFRNKIFNSDKGIFDDFENHYVENGKSSYGLTESKRRGRLEDMLDSIPLPDWGKGKPRNITSSLTKEYFNKKAAELLRGRFKRRAELIKKINGVVDKKSFMMKNPDLMSAVERLKFLHAQVGSDISNVNKPWSREYHQAKYLGVFDKELQILTKIASRVEKSALAGTPDAKEKGEKKEKTGQKATKIKEIKVGKNGISVVGENLPEVGKSIKINPTDAWFTIQPKITSGMRSVKLKNDMSKLDSNLTSLLRKAIELGLRQYVLGPDAKKQATTLAGKIDSKQLKELKKEKLDKHKPKIIVYGTASMEGGFEANKQIALARARSAKKQLEGQGYQVEARWVIQGLREKVTTKGGLKKHEKLMVDEWNSKISPKAKVKGIDEVYAKLKKLSSLPAKEKAFLEKFFISARRVVMQVEYPKKATNTQIAMKFEKSSNALT